VPEAANIGLTNTDILQIPIRTRPGSSLSTKLEAPAVVSDGTISMDSGGIAHA
jgi:hypothetical protein